jgi:hypothetical protein
MRGSATESVLERDQGDEKLPTTGLPEEDATKKVQEQQPTDKVQLLGAEIPTGEVKKRKDPVYKKRYKKKLADSSTPLAASSHTQTAADRQAVIPQSATLSVGQLASNGK